MAQVPYDGGVPTVAPTATPPDAYQRIQASPDAFGASIGRGLEKAGAGVEQTSANLFDASKFWGSVQVDGSLNNSFSGANDVVSNFRSLRGQAALDAQADTEKQIDDIFKSGREGLKSPAQQLQYDQAARAFKERYVQGLIRSHADTEGKAHATTVNSSKQQIAQNSAANVANDPEAVKLFVGDAEDAALHQLEIEGNAHDPIVVRAALARAGQAVYTSVAQAKSVHDPNGALEYIEQHRRELGDQYDNLANATRVRADQQFGTTRAAARFGDLQAGATQAPVAGVPANFVSGIKASEGFAPKAAWDYKQNTNGFGTRAQSPNEVIDRATADQRFNSEISKAAQFVDKFAPDLDPGTRAALTSLTFNAGTDWANGGLGAAIKAGDIETAKAAFLQYNKAGGVENPGLVARRQREASWFGQNDIAPASTKATLYQQMMTDPELKDRPAALNAALNWVNHTITQQEFAEAADRKSRQMASDNAENATLKDIYSDKPTMTVSSILNNPALLREAQERMINVMGRVTNPDPIARVSAQTSMGLIDAMRKPDGDPEKLTDQSPIFDAYIARKLTRPDFEFLRKQFNDGAGAEAGSLPKLKKAFTDQAKEAINLANMGGSMTGGSGTFARYEFERLIDRKVDDYRKSGKDPTSLFDPGSSDYLGKPDQTGRPAILKPFLADMQQSTRNAASEIPPAPSRPPPSADERKRLDDWMRARGAPVPAEQAPGVPISR